ncbi:MAG: hypothetical protein Q8886_02880, partial [Candidatus Phytoplasma australasiaticum]|nr:hypothetical protein [Candidatus Phytoplasma australasiaticum]
MTSSPTLKACTRVGLGNPGLNFNFTPHNVGFMLIDYLLKEFR